MMKEVFNDLLVVHDTIPEEEEDEDADEFVFEESSICSLGIKSINNSFKGRRKIKEESHPQRQSTPRRRLLEAQLADKLFSDGPESKEEEQKNNICLTPRLMRSSSAAATLHHAHGGFDGGESWNMGSFKFNKRKPYVGDHNNNNNNNSNKFQNINNHDDEDADSQVEEKINESKLDTPRHFSFGTLEQIAAKAREVANESLLAGTRNVAKYSMTQSQSVQVLPTYQRFSQDDCPHHGYSECKLMDQIEETKAC